MASPTTNDDKKVAAALAIRDVSNNLHKFNQTLEEAINTLNDPNCSQAKRGRVAKAVMEVNQAIAASAQQLLVNVKVLDPIPSLDYVHSRQKPAPVLQTVANKLPPINECAAPKPKRRKAVLPTKRAAIDLPKP